VPTAQCNPKNNMKKFRPRRNVDYDRSFFIRIIFCFLMVIGTLFVIYIFTRTTIFTLKHVLILSLCSIPFCVLYAYVIEKLGSGLSGLLSGWISREISLRDQFSADLEKAREHKRESHPEEALDIINELLNKEEDFPDALFLKAQILWEKFGRSVESKQLFRRVMQLATKEDPLHRWSSNYCHEISMKDKAIADEFKSKSENWPVKEGQ
jgi:hypothetical protein